MLSIRLERHDDNLWTIKVVETDAIIFYRRWTYQVDAINWTKAVMSSFDQTYTLEVVDGKQHIEQSGTAKASSLGDNK